MGVYIPNAVPPEECQRCRFIELMNGQWKLQCWLNLKPIPSEGKRDDCPLIEIDLERDIPTVWYNRQTGQYEPKGTKQEVYERLYKLKNGERRESR